MKKVVGAVILIAAAIAGYWLYQKKSSPPPVPFTRTAHETISNILSTNGKVEPSEYVDVRAEMPGLVKRVLVHAGDTVRQGQLLAEMSEPGLQQELDAAVARESQARAELGTLQGGGKSADTSEIDASVSRLKTDRDAAQRNLESLERLVSKQAATPYELEQAKQAVKSLDVQIQSLQQRRSALVGKGDVAGAQARLDEARANVALAHDRINRDLIRAPMSGVVYDLPARAGAVLNAADPIASIGKLDPVRVRVYVDEPEMGRVADGQNVRITWDALPGKEWHGTVEKRPTEVIALGTRQVGEVPCTIDNPMRELVPGTNVNAFILTQVVENALTIPKSAVRRDGVAGVYVLQGDNTVKFQAIKTGPSDALRVQVLGGLPDGATVALPSDVTLKDGMRVMPQLQ